MKKTIEGLVSETVLQEKKTVTAGRFTFNVAPPTPATMIQVSKLISQLPCVKLDEANFIYETLSIAEKCGILGELVATMIIGVKKQSNTHAFIKKLLKRLKIGRKTEIEELAEFIHFNVSNSELELLAVELLKGLEIQSFFQLIVSLIEVNLLRATR